MGEAKGSGVGDGDGELVGEAVGAGVDVGSGASNSSVAVIGSPISMQDALKNSEKIRHEYTSEFLLLVTNVPLYRARNKIAPQEFIGLIIARLKSYD